MKKRIIVNLVLATLLIISVILTGCNKTTGGGAFYDETTGNFVTFGFNAQPVGEPYLDDSGEYVQDAKGHFTLIDHTIKTKIKGAFNITGAVQSGFETESAFSGTCMVNREGPYDLYGHFLDAGEGNPGDYLAILWDSGYYSGYLEDGSDIVVHVPQAD